MVLNISDSKQSLIKEFTQLLSQQYEPLIIKDEKDLYSNLIKQITNLNENLNLQDWEWNSFWNNEICKKEENYIRKIERILKWEKQNTQYRQIKILVDKENFLKNNVQFLESQEGITLFLNGFPVVQIFVAPKEMNIESLFHECKKKRNLFNIIGNLFDYICIFIISNGEKTKYFSSSIWNKRGDNFSYCSDWEYYEKDSNPKPKKCENLSSFTNNFLSKETLLKILINYTVLEKNLSSKKETLMIMRPYQIHAVEEIIKKIKALKNKKELTDKEMLGGYIWHSTGSGKTLTSFKAAKLASKMEEVEKVLVVVDRQDIDEQTVREYKQFEQGSQGSFKDTDDTKDLEKELKDNRTKEITTSIQKLDSLIRYRKESDIYKKRIIMIFDECHRGHVSSNLEDEEHKLKTRHDRIKKYFKNTIIFGFTGTPIWEKNDDGKRLDKTAKFFGERLHSYNMMDAIEDKNVLIFNFSFPGETIKGLNFDAKNAFEKQKIKEEGGDELRIKSIVSFILEDFDNKTLRIGYGLLKEKREKGYNSILVVSSVKAAMKYYEKFKETIDKQTEKDKKLLVTTIFTADSEDKKKFLSKVINEYNDKIQDNKFFTPELYKKDVAKRLKNGTLDILIVYDMFLTGFDSKKINTLWVDRFLENHGLIQACSRTNRVSESQKTMGNVVFYQTTEQEVVEAFGVYGYELSKMTAQSFKEILNGYDDRKGRKIKGFIELDKELKEKFPIKNKEVYIENENIKKVEEFADIFQKRKRSLDRLKNHGYKKYEEFVKEYIDPAEEKIYDDKYLELRADFERKREGKYKDIICGFIEDVDIIESYPSSLEFITGTLISQQLANVKKPEEKEKLINNILNMMTIKEQLKNKIEPISRFINEEKDLSKDNFDGCMDKYFQEELKQLFQENPSLDAEKIYEIMQECLKNREFKISDHEMILIKPFVRKENSNVKNLIIEQEKIREKMKSLFNKYVELVFYKEQQIKKHEWRLIKREFEPKDFDEFDEEDIFKKPPNAKKS